MMDFTLAAWLHDLDPLAFGPIRWYGLSYLAGFAIAWLLIRRVLTVGSTPLKPVQTSDLVVAVAIGIIVGGRVGYVLFYRPDLMWTFYPGLPFWGVLAINEGGMASHGGMLGGIVASWLFARRHALPMRHVLDLIVFAGPLGVVFGRIANFINGELIGRAAPEWLPWAVKFPQEMYDWTREQWEQAPGALQELSIPQIVTQVQRGNEHVIALVEPMLTPRHPSQLYAAVLEGLVVFLVLLWLWRKPRVPGLVAGVFCITYAAGRIVNEFFRRPDVHIQDAEFAWLAITRGQLLSLGLLALGVWLVWWVQRQKLPAMGGWRRGPWTQTASELQRQDAKTPSRQVKNKGREAD
ncbi:prolipoprotein diacylglyceryl transferase [Phycisphaerales bacterium AB-hyl4]|uniref:Phosphatidylglycerol--prolipoprotein diacylglyceryl transferase n=1 Tax=Natronomicrosphaera hydrolytica TaxID=3242702 RepID=A0ABV4U501_9BACT